MENTVKRTFTENTYVGLTKTSFREIRLILFLFSIALIMVAPSLYNPKIDNISYDFIFTNLIIGITSISMIVLEARKYKFSLHIMQWIFQFSFFFIAPHIQYLNNTFMWGQLTSDDTDLLIKSNGVILLWQLIWIVTSYFTQRKYRNSTMIEKPLPQINMNPSRLFILFVLSFAALFFFVYSFGAAALLARGSEKSSALIANASLLQIVYNVGKSLPIVLLVCSFYKYKMGNNRTVWAMIALIASIVVLFLNFPTATSRFWAATVYIGLILTFFKIKSKNTLVYMLIFGLFIVFPALGFARNAKNFGEFITAFKLDGLHTNNIASGDYDAFSMINYTVRYIELYGVTYGKQLLGALFFFIPRSVWETKPIGSGSAMSVEFGLSFDNISEPLPAEGLINFGIPGLILFAVLFSYLTKKFDLMFWHHPNGSAILKTLYPFIIGLFFFMIRGDLLSTFSLTVSFSFAFFIFLRSPKKKYLD